MRSIGLAYQLLGGVRSAGNLRVLCTRLLAVMEIVMLEEVIGPMNGLIHSSAESLH
jgi:hypothetical protein